MSAWRWELEPDLEQAVLAGALTLHEAWLLMDDRLTNPLEPVPSTLRPLQVRLFLFSIKTAGQPKQ